MTTTGPVIAVYGAGAVGCFFGAKLAEAGHAVRLIARPPHVAAIRADGLRFESAAGTRFVPMTATSDIDEGLAGADLVLVCVKTPDTEEAGRVIADRLGTGAVVVSLQNGVDNAERLWRGGGIDALAAVVYVATSMPGPGHLRHAGRGDLVIGDYGPARAGRVREPGRAMRIAALFEGAGVPCPASADVRVELWVKLIVNCAFNAISALTRSRYGPMIADERIRVLMREVIGEAVAVARAEGIAVPDVDAQFAGAMAIGEAMAPATSSTAQDLSRGRRTEIDALNGYVAERGRALGVPTPANQALHALVRLAEAEPIPPSRQCRDLRSAPFEKGGQPDSRRLGVSPDTDSPCGLSVPGERHRLPAGGPARRLLARLWAFLPFHAMRVARSAVEN